MNSAIVHEAFLAALAIGESGSLSAIRDRVRNFAKPYGFDRFVLFSASAPAEEPVKHIYWVEGVWFGNGESVDTLTYVRRCPVTRHMLLVSAPFFWSKISYVKLKLYNVAVPHGAGNFCMKHPVAGPGNKNILHAAAVTAKIYHVTSNLPPTRILSPKIFFS